MFPLITLYYKEVMDKKIEFDYTLVQNYNDNLLKKSWKEIVIIPKSMWRKKVVIIPDDLDLEKQFANPDVLFDFIIKYWESTKIC